MSAESDELSTKEKVLNAAAELIAEHGPRGATTRKIADAAGVNETTLFRNFGSKAEIIAATLRKMGSAFSSVGEKPSDDVEADLERFACAYLKTALARREMLSRMMPEIRANPALAAVAKPALLHVRDRLLNLFSHHQRAGRLIQSEPPEMLALAFIGPMLALAMAGDVLEIDPDFDAGRYVQNFLGGWGA